MCIQVGSDTDEESECFGKELKDNLFSRILRIYVYVEGSVMRHDIHVRVMPKHWKSHS